MPIRQLKIDYTAPLPDAPVVAGYVGEHNATELIIVPPPELISDEVKSYVVLFKTGGRVLCSRPFEPGEEIAVPLWEQLTGERTLSLQLEGHGSDGELIAKSPTAYGLTLLPSPDGADTPTETGGADLVAAVAANTAARHEHGNKPTLDKLGEDGEGQLTYDGVALVNAVLSSLKKWDGGRY